MTMTSDKQTLIDALLLACGVEDCGGCGFHKLALEFESGNLVIIPSKNLRMLDSLMRAVVNTKRKEYDDNARNARLRNSG